MQPQGQNQPNQAPAQPVPANPGVPSNQPAQIPNQPVTSPPSKSVPVAMPAPAVNTVSPGTQVPSPPAQSTAPTAQSPTAFAQPAFTNSQPPTDQPGPTATTPPTAPAQPSLPPQATNLPGIVQPEATHNEQFTPQQSDQTQAVAEKPVEAAETNATKAQHEPKEVNATDTFIRALVYLQFFTLFIILVGFFPGPLFFNTFAMVSGALMIGVGIFLGIWAVMSFRQKISPNPKPLKHSFLVTGGPYKYMRHPMYAAIILAAVGLMLIYPTIIRVIAVLILVLVIISKMNIEEYLLAKRYHHYARYQRITGKMIPKFKKPDIDIDIDLPRFEQ